MSQHEVKVIRVTEVRAHMNADSEQIGRVLLKIVGNGYMTRKEK